ncbi:MAG: pentapeptide repeat-containing protein [Alphaproteobacteria bacterium]|nr:pentapeptide repeat-containing protein [Alphaproteobacteria bacterium]
MLKVKRIWQYTKEWVKRKWQALLLQVKKISFTSLFVIIFYPFTIINKIIKSNWVKWRRKIKVFSFTVGNKFSDITDSYLFKIPIIIIFGVLIIWNDKNIQKLVELISNAQDSSISNTLIIFIILYFLIAILVSFILWITLNIKTAIRFICLSIFFAISVGFAALITNYHREIIPNLFSISTYDSEFYSITYRGLLYSIPPLPLLFIIWWFRHADTQENLHQNALFEAQNKMLEPTVPHKALAMQQLKILLKQVPSYEKQILLTLEEAMHKSAWSSPLPPSKTETETKTRIKTKTKTFNLKDFKLLNRDFSNAILNHENLQEKNLRKINLQNANLAQSNLQYANLFKADLRGANLVGADLRGANLQKADLRNATLKYTNLRHADLRHADLKNARLYLIDLRNANLQDATLPIFDSTEMAKRANKNIEMANNPDEELIQAVFNDFTTPPDGEEVDEFKKKAMHKYGMKHVDDLTPEELKKLNARYK